MTPSLTPSLSLASRWIALISFAALFSIIFYTQLSHEQTNPTITNPQQLRIAPSGELWVHGVLHLELERSYNRTYSAMGQSRSEALRVVPLTDEAWSTGDPIYAWAILREPTQTNLFEGRAVKLGGLDPSWKVDLSVAKDAALLELSTGQPPPWLAYTGFGAGLALLLLAIRRLLWPVGPGTAEGASRTSNRQR